MADIQRDAFFGNDPGGVMPGDTGFHDRNETQNHVRFYYNEVYKQDFCEIHFPANRQSVWNQPVRDVDKQRYPRQWALYKEGKSQFADQTMLENLPGMDQGSLTIYHSMHIRTVEQLASVPDGNMDNFPAGHGILARRHREMAKEFLEEKKQSQGFDQALAAAAQSQAMAQQALADKEALEARIAELEKATPAPTQGDAFPQHAGGPWYLLSNGEKVKGKRAAEQKEAELAA